MIVAYAAVLSVFAVAALLFIRERDLPQPAPVSPFQHLDERKAAIYENLRDLQFEYRVGKLSDEDYQQSKLTLQKELALVLSQVDQVKAELQLNPTPAAPPLKPVVKAASVTVCSACGAEFGQVLKFCGDCGAAIPGARSGGA